MANYEVNLQVALKGAEKIKKLRTEMENSFHLVQTYKPAASKSKSGEIYLYGEMPK